MHSLTHARAPTRAAAALLRGSVAALCAALIAGCAGGEPRFFEQRIYSMGTWVDVTVGAADERQAAAAIGDVEVMLRRFETDYYAWADGELRRLNEGL